MVYGGPVEPGIFISWQSRQRYQKWIFTEGKSIGNSARDVLVNIELAVHVVDRQNAQKAVELVAAEGERA